jgi:YbbR domain-containing protein
MLFTTGQYSESEHRTISFRRLLRKIFIDDWPMKLIALVITFALYLGVTGEEVKATFPSIPLNLRISDNADFISPPPEAVEVVLKGDKNKIDELSQTRNNLVVFIDLTDRTIGDSVIDLTPETVKNLPPGVQVVQVRPEKIAIKTEPVIEKEIPVKAETEGSLTDGSVFKGEAVVTPQKVRVRGPVSYIKTLEFVSTERISVENKSSDFTAKQVTVNVSNPKLRIIDAVVDVAFRIGEQPGKKDILVGVKGDPPGRKMTVRVEGALSVLKGIKPGDLKVEMVPDETGKMVPRFVDLPAELLDKIEIVESK